MGNPGKLWRAALLTAGAALAVQVAAYYVMRHGNWRYVPEYIHPAVQAPVFLFGITAALLAQRVRLPHVPGLALVLLTAATIGIPLLSMQQEFWFLLLHLPFAALGAACVALAAQHPPHLLVHPTMRRLGEVSYSLYLLHFAVLAPSLFAAEWLVPGDGWPTLILHTGLTLACSFVLARLTYRWVEQPCIRGAVRLLQARHHAAGATASN